MVRLTKKDWMEGLRFGLIVVIGAPIVALILSFIPVLGPLIEGLPTYALGPVDLNLEFLAQAVIAIVLGNAGLKMIK